jgi:hypothetical protein
MKKAFRAKVMEGKEVKNITNYRSVRAVDQPALQYCFNTCLLHKPIISHQALATHSYFLCKNNYYKQIHSAPKMYL